MKLLIVSQKLNIQSEIAANSRSVAEYIADSNTEITDLKDKFVFNSASMDDRITGFNYLALTDYNSNATII